MKARENVENSIVVTLDIAILAECIDFCQFEGKTTYESFEVDLVERLMQSIMKSTFPLGTELLISAYFAKIDDFHDSFQQNLAAKLTEDSVSALLYKFDFNSALNKRLIALCSKKGVFADESKESVLIRIMMYGKELQEFQAGNSEPSLGQIENLTIGDEFKPDARSVM